MIPDSIATNEDYAKRALEVGDPLLSSVEHGWQGRYISTYKLAHQNNLKCLIGSEVYWVKDRTLPDTTNCHMCVLAKNENGRRALNDMLSEASLSGFYYRPRVDLELLHQLPPEDIWITTACIAGWKYEDADDIFRDLHEHFGEHMFLEVQYHNTESQIALNQHILQLRDELKMPIIMGCDSHYINEKDAQYRNDFIESKGISYPDEEGWYLDYPDGNTAYKRFANQGVLTHAQIEEAMSNTLIFTDVEEYDSPIFDDSLKLPTLYPDWTQEQRDEEYKRIVWNGWSNYKKEVPEHEHEVYEHEIEQEIKTVVDTKMCDYFIMNYHIIKKGIENGGELTKTGRGSAVSFFTSKLLGFTEVDRIAAKVKMYPERFMSTTRILEAKTLPDIDFNVSNPEPFARAQQEILGHEHAYPMLAYGTNKVAAAWKLYAKSQGVPFEIANKVSEQIKKYELAIKHADEDSKDDIDVLNFIEPQFYDIWERAQGYIGTITSWSIAPCGYLLYQGDIRKEIGLIKIKDHICCLMDGHWAEEGHFLKNDLLTVKVVDLIYRSYREAGIPLPSVNELLKKCPPNDSCWDVYKKGATMGINQVEQTGTSARVQIYAPKNISELTAFVAAIRPGFKSMYKIFESREPFSYKVKPFDDLLQTEEMPNSFMLYQEQAMAAMNYAGILMSECYTAIKNIAKKRAEKVLALKGTFVDGFKKAIEEDGASEEIAKEKASMVWQVIEDSSSYSFNASHAYCVALDSLYGAWLKAHHPLAFYKAYLAVQEAKGDKDKMNAAKEEAESYFGIKFPPFRFGQDNRDVVANPITNEITNPLSSIKGYSKTMARACYECAKQNYEDFIDVLAWFDDRSIKTAKLLPLIRIDYFEQFGNAPTLSRICDIWDQFHQGKAKQIRKDSIPESLYGLFSPYLCSINAKGEELKTAKITDAMELVRAYEHHIKTLEIPDVPYKVKMQNQLDILGYVDLTTRRPEDRRKLIITDCTPQKSKTKNEIWAYRVGTKSIGTGKTARLTIRTDVFDREPLAVGDIVFARDLNKNKAGYWYLNGYERLI